MTEFGRRRTVASPSIGAERPRATWRDPAGTTAPQSAAGRAPTDMSADAQRFLATGQPPSWVTTTRGGLFGGIAFFAGLLCFMLWGYGADVVRDWRLSGTWRPALDVKVGEAKCTRYVFLVSTCDVKYSWTEKGATRAARASFIVGFKSAGGTPVVPVRSTQDANAVTAYISANDWLMNRTITLLVFVALFGMGMVGCARNLATGRHKDGAAYDDLVAELRAMGAVMQAKEAASGSGSHSTRAA